MRHLIFNKQLIVALIVAFMPVIYSSAYGKDHNEIILKPSGKEPMTAAIQKAIDKCSREGGGIVRFTEGTYFSGSVELKSKVSLKLDTGVIIQGSNQYTNYRNDAFFFGKDLSDLTIEGQGIIDGVNCYNPEGEEGFRGPHCIKLINCRNIKISGITIQNSANWAINCRHCSVAVITNVKIRGGHDGLHTRFCNNFTVTKCDFRTGDDAFAGNDNFDFNVSDCLVNTSCNGFRLGCMNLTVKHCRFWGPGESVHMVQKRNNMLSAFVHFSPRDENPKLKSGNWTIEDIVVENVDNFFIYNNRNGLWQTGQPFTTVSFNEIHASGILKAFYITGDTVHSFNMSLKNSSFSYRHGEKTEQEKFEGVNFQSGEFFYANHFNTIILEGVKLEMENQPVLLKAENGKEISLSKIEFNKKSDNIPASFNNVENVNQVMLSDPGGFTD